MQDGKLQQIHEQHIKGRPNGAIIVLEIFVLAILTEQVQAHLKLVSAKVYLKTRVLKHLYEKRPARVYDFLLDNLSEIVRFPDEIYQSPDAKRGALTFVKHSSEGSFMCSIETNAHPEIGEEVNVIVTAFKIDHRYTRKYKLIWKWEDGDASS